MSVFSLEAYGSHWEQMLWKSAPWLTYPGRQKCGIAGVLQVRKLFLISKSGAGVIGTSGSAYGDLQFFFLKSYLFERHSYIGRGRDFPSAWLTAPDSRNSQGWDRPNLGARFPLWVPRYLGHLPLLFRCISREPDGKWGVGTWTRSVTKPASFCLVLFLRAFWKNIVDGIIKLLDCNMYIQLFVR